MNKFQKRAIELAIENVDNGGSPYGAVVVKDGEIIGEGVDTLSSIPDISGHAEMSAIKHAQAKLGRIDLSDCVVYASGHPCPMCFGAITLSNIKKIVYTNTPEEASAHGMTLTESVYRYLKGDVDAIDLDVERSLVSKNEIDPLLYWVEKRKDKK